VLHKAYVSHIRWRGQRRCLNADHTVAWKGHILQFAAVTPTKQPSRLQFTTCFVDVTAVNCRVWPFHATVRPDGMPATENGSMWLQCRPEPYGYNYHLAAWHGCQSSRSTFRPFRIPTPVKDRRYELLYIDCSEVSLHSTQCWDNSTYGPTYKDNTRSDDCPACNPVAAWRRANHALDIRGKPLISYLHTTTLPQCWSSDYFAKQEQWECRWRLCGVGLAEGRSLL